MKNTSLGLESLRTSPFARVPACLGALFVASALIACSSSSSSGTTPSNDGGNGDTGVPPSGDSGMPPNGDSGNPGTDSGNPGTDSGVSSDSSVPPTDGGGDAAACEQNCINNNMAGYTKFAGYQLQNCGCASGSVCTAMCTAECMNPSTLTMNSPCGTCIFNEANKGAASACTVTAGVACLGDSTCSPFVTCEQACM